jgi:hypothetical protein
MRFSLMQLLLTTTCVCIALALFRIAWHLPGKFALLGGCALMVDPRGQQIVRTVGVSVLIGYSVDLVVLAEIEQTPHEELLSIIPLSTTFSALIGLFWWTVLSRWQRISMFG